jgi:hypothetical protein
LFHCGECREELNQMEEMGQALRLLPAAAPPKDLAFQIQLGISQERLRRQAPGWWWRIRSRWGDVAAPALSGIFAAIVMFGLFLPQMPITLGVRQNDTPLFVRTPARLRGTGPMELVTRAEDLMVQVLVDRNGRVADYRIVDGIYTPQDVRDLRNRLLFTQFDPARANGVPRPERLLLAFRSVRVRG